MSDSSTSEPDGAAPNAPNADAAATAATAATAAGDNGSGSGGDNSGGSDNGTSSGGDNSGGDNSGGDFNIQPVELVSEVEESFLEYALSVIISRALPDARDGLKPVHRRILWSMSESGLRPDRGHVKCATVVGDVIAKYHPHGDSAVYDAMVRMGQDFSLRYMLVDPHGNFGSPGDRAAAYRYTECRLSALAAEMLEGIDEETVDFTPNFDGRHQEPQVLPSRFPNLLVNGSQGIAVGMATNIPPHNLNEVIDAVTHLLREPDVSDEALLEHIQGPDFPTGGLILGKQGIRSTYLTGRGAITLRARTEIETTDDTSRIVVTEMPYQVSVESIGLKVQQLVDRKESQELAGIKEMRDESAKGQTRLVFELKKEANPDVVLNNLFKNTRLQTSFAANMVALDNGIPRTMTLRQLLESYTGHQIDVVTRRSEFRLRKAQERAHILEGLLRAVDMLDEVIAAIRASENRAAAREALMAEPFEFSEPQTEHILDMTLSRLTRIARQEFEEEYEAKQAEIAELTEILSDDARLKAVIIDELGAIKDQFSESRRSEISSSLGVLDLEDLIDDDMVVFVMSAAGYGKCVLASQFRTQGRGGLGIKAATVNDDDNIKKIIHTSAHSYLLFFTNFGRMFRIKAYELPFQGRTAKGVPLVNFFDLQDGEEIAEVIDTRDYETFPYLMFVTQKGLIKKSLFTQYDSNFRGLKALVLQDGDELVKVEPVKADVDVALITAHGQAIRFSLDEVRQTGRASRGVRGIRLRAGDKVVAPAVIEPDGHLVLVSVKGFAKRTEFDSFTARHRGGYGVKCFNTKSGRGELAGALSVEDDSEIMLISHGGMMVRVPVSDLSIQGRTATGVTTMKLKGDDFVKDVVPAPAEPPEDELAGAAEFDDDAELAGAAELDGAPELADEAAQNSAEAPAETEPET